MPGQKALHGRLSKCDLLQETLYIRSSAFGYLVYPLTPTPSYHIRSRAIYRLGFGAKRLGFRLWESGLQGLVFVVHEPSMFREKMGHFT